LAFEGPNHSYGSFAPLPVVTDAFYSSQKQKLLAVSGAFRVLKKPMGFA
jgi:hypothetical protein